MRKLKYFFLLTACLLVSTTLSFAQKKKKDKHSTEKEWTNQAKDDHNFLSKADLSQKEKFYNAIQLRTTGQIDTSAAYFEQCVQQNPNNDAAFYALAEYYTAKHQDEKALKNIESAYKIDPNNTWYLEFLAYSQQAVANYEEAEKSFGQLSKIDVHNIDWLYGYSEAQLYNGKIKEAIDTYTKMIAEVGPAPELIHRKIQLMEDQKQNDAIVSELKELIQKYPEAPEYPNMLVDYYQKHDQKKEAKTLLEDLIKKNPNNGFYQLDLSDYYNQEGNKELTYKYLKLAFANDDIDLDTKVKLLISMHDSQSAIDSTVFDLVKVLEDKYPNDAKTYAIKGDLLLKNKQKAAALIAFKKALTFDDSKFSIWNEALILEYETQAFDSLYVDAQKALELFPSFSNVYLLAGIGAYQTKHYDDAVSFFSQGKNYSLKDQRLTAQFDFQLGESYAVQKNMKSATEFYNKAIELDPNNALYFNNFAYNLAINKTDLDKAVELAIKANELEPKNANFMDTYAWALFQKKNYAEAKEKLEEALIIGPTSSDMFEHFGDVLFFLDEKDKALEYWQKAKDAGENNDTLNRKINNKTYYEQAP